jgi:D-sedoheptulose 7-phosphate isomerase
MTFNFVSNHQEHQLLFNNLSALEPLVNQASTLISKAFVSGNKLMICGNGGSAADSQHIAAEMTGRFIKDRKPLPAIALTTDTSALTCIANDYSYEHVFARQVEALGHSGDILLAISTSGNSENVIRAMQVAKDLGVKTVALTGRDGGKINSLADFSIVVPSQTTARIQEAHIFIGHIICGLVEKNLGFCD